MCFCLVYSHAHLARFVTAALPGFERTTSFLEIALLIPSATSALTFEDARKAFMPQNRLLEERNIYIFTH